MKQESTTNIREALLRLLSRREHSFNELLRKLTAKGWNKDEIKPVLEDLREQGYQSDIRFTESFVRSKSAKGSGPNKIRAELQEHKIDNVAVEQTMASLTIDWDLLAQEVHNKKFGSSPPKNWTDKQKRARFLLYRGFTQEQIQSTFNLDD